MEQKGIGGQIDREKREKCAEQIIKVMTENEMTYREAMATLKYVYNSLSNKGENLLDDLKIQEVLPQSSYRYIG